MWSVRKTFVAFAGTLVLPWAFAAAARAQGFSSASGCPSGNLLAGKLPASWQFAGGRHALVTDGKVAPEGAQWDAPLALVLDGGAATLTYDLGAPTTIHAVWVQADANDSYTLFGSLDGSNFLPLGRVEPVDGHGLRGRTMVGLGSTGVVVRFLRFGDGVGDNYYSVSEIQAFCEVPTPFPPKPTVENAPPAKVAKNIYTYWNNNVSARWELILAALGCLLLAWELRLRAQGRAQAYRRLRSRLLAALGLVAFATYFNFGFFHFPNFVHSWDTFHYYVGSKYFRELSYDRLYRCVAVADAEDPLLRRRVELRKITNLSTNLLETTDEILKHPERCKRHFTAARWESFKHDVAHFRNRETPRRWDDSQTDHGYNGTPVWNIAGTMLSNLAPASRMQILLLDLFDPAYLVGVCLVVWWAFGWRVLCVGLLAFSTNFPSRFYWTGGSFLRWDWLFYLVATVCCLKKERPLLAGLAVGYAALLRVFPGFLGVGPVLAVGCQLVSGFRARRAAERAALAQAATVAVAATPAGPGRWLASIDRRYLSFFVGAALAVAILVPLSIQTAGGAQAYKNFVQNTIKHKETPLTNYMGLRTVVAYRPSEAGRFMRSDRFTDPWQKWKDARLDTFRKSKPIYVVAVLAFLVLLGFAVRKAEPWEAAALSATFIAVGVELTCYYYAFIIAVAVLHLKDERVGRILLLCTAFTQFVDWRPLPSMPGWLDEQYTLMSVGTLAAFGVILWNFGLGKVLAARQAAWRAATGAALSSAPAPRRAQAAIAGADRSEPPHRKRRSRNRRRGR